MNKPLRMRLLPLVIGSLLAASTAFAQNTSSSLSGRLVDASGQPVAGATVQILHVPSGTTKTVTTDANGHYIAHGLRVGGPFFVTADKAGETAERNDVYLKLAEETKLDLTTGATDAMTLEGITVTASALTQVFQPDNKGLSTNVSGRELQNAPSANRSIQDIARLDPRIVVTDRGDGSMSAMGQNSRYNAISVDSVNVGDPFGLNSNGMPYIGSPVSVDTIAEYNLSTANFDVSSSAVGASINAVTKSGTNEFHGSAYFAYRNAKDLTGDAGWLDSDNDFYEYRGYEHNRTYGLTLGGPIIKDTLFFFLGYEEETTTALGADAANGLDESLGDGPSTSNRVSPGDLNRIIDIATGLGLQPGTFGDAGADLKDKRLLTKLDWNINDSHRASLSFQRTKENQPIVQGNNATSVGLSSFWYNKDSDTKNTVLHLFSDWTDTFSTEATVSHSSFSQVRTTESQQPQVVIRLNEDGTGPTVNLGEDQFSHYNVLDVKSWNAFAAGTWNLDEHAIKVGFDYQQNEIYNLFGRTQFGAYTFWGIDNFAQGIYNQFDLYQPAEGLTIDDVAAEWTYKQWGLFLQDTWQVNDALSVQYGLRVDIPKTGDKPLYNAEFEQAFGVRNDSTIDNELLFQPRISFNMDLGGPRMTQLRGGFGKFMSNPPTVWMTNPYQNNGLTTATYSARNSDGVIPAPGTEFPPFSPDPFNQNLPPRGSSQMTVDAIDPDFKLPSVWKFTVAIDHELPWWETVFSAEYQRIAVEDGILYENLNIGAPTGVLPDGRYTYYRDPLGAPSGNRNRHNANGDFSGNVTLLRNTDKGSSDNVTLSLRKPFSDNWSGNIAASFGRASEVNPGTSSQASSNYSNNWWINPNEDVASPSNGSIRQRLSASLTWEHEFFGDYATAVTAFYDGHTGNPYSWVFGNDMNGDSYSRDLVYIPNPGDVSFTADTTAAQQQQFYDFIANNDYLSDHRGEIAGRNGANSAWVNQVDLSFRQEVPGFFPEGAKGELRLDIFNLMNLLNKDWGQQEYVGFPYGRTLANYQGVGADGKPIYSLPTDGDGNYQPGGTIVYDAGRDIKTNVVSRWSAMITLRYTF